MAKGSVRKKGKKWYYRFYVEDASGKMVQKEYAGTESKSETEKLLRKALEDYEDKKFVAKADNLTVGELLDMWAEEELKTGTLSNGTVENYLSAIRCTKKHPIADRKLKTVTAEHLQAFLDLLGLPVFRQGDSIHNTPCFSHAPLCSSCGGKVPRTASGFSVVPVLLLSIFQSAYLQNQQSLLSFAWSFQSHFYALHRRNGYFF